MPAKAFVDDVQPARQRSIAEGAVCLARKGERMVATRDFSGLVNSTWAFARAAAMAAIVLERFMDGPPHYQSSQRLMSVWPGSRARLPPWHRQHRPKCRGGRQMALNSKKLAEISKLQ
jgi:hypothetical protein